MPNNFKCEICKEQVFHPDTDVAYQAIQYAFDHFKNMHPEVEMQTWPDGGPVVVDKSDPTEWELPE